MLDVTQLTGKQRRFLLLLQQQESVESLRSHCAHHGFDFNFIKGFLLSGALEGYVQWQEHSQATWVITPKGQELNGSLPGFLLAEQILQGTTNWVSLQTSLGPAFSINFGALRREAAVDVMGQGEEARINVLKPGILRDYENRQKVFTAVLEQVPVSNVDGHHLEWLQQQGFIAQKVELDYRLMVLPALNTLELKPLVTALTSDLLLSGRWQQVDLKPYDTHDAVPDISYGRPTILTQCIQRIRDIFLNMGFDEMSGYIVESAFWNFDALFTPQDHPAREMQDTFYLANPQTVPLPADQPLIDRVQRVHEANYGGEWTKAEASRAILRPIRPLLPPVGCIN
jgi:phenylalanyl-tRNA synthetase alpha chain